MELRKLNSLRGLAVLIVMISHHTNETWFFHFILGTGAGQLGVMLFFLLSSFLMAHLYLRMPPTRIALQNFVVARIARVIPLFLVVVLASYLLKQSGVSFAGFLGYNIGSGKSLLEHLLLLRGEGLLWTIPPEIHFYMLFAVVWLLRPYCWRWIIAVMGGIVAAFLSGFWPGDIRFELCGLDVTFDLIKVLPYFIVGAGFGYLYVSWQPPTWLRSHWFALAPLLILLLYPKIFGMITGQAHAMWSSPGVLIAISCIFFLTVFLVPEKNRALENWLGDKLGELSYSLYLLHYPVLLILRKNKLAGGLLGLSLFMAIALLLAAISFRFIEAPMRSRIRNRFMVRATASVAVSPQS